MISFSWLCFSASQLPLVGATLSWQICDLIHTTRCKESVSTHSLGLLPNLPYTWLNESSSDGQLSCLYWHGEAGEGGGSSITCVLGQLSCLSLLHLYRGHKAPCVWKGHEVDIEQGVLRQVGFTQELPVALTWGDGASWGCFRHSRRSGVCKALMEHACLFLGALLSMCRQRNGDAYLAKRLLLACR